LTQIFAGGDQTFILRHNDVLATGDNRWGQLGIEAEEKMPFLSQFTVVASLQDQVGLYLNAGT
jgi:hypothetical protein